MPLEYGTLVPMHFMNLRRKVKVVSVSGWCAYSTIDESRRVGAAFREAIDAYPGKVAIIASGSLSHRIGIERARQRGDGAGPVRLCRKR